MLKIAFIAALWCYPLLSPGSLAQGIHTAPAYQRVANLKGSVRLEGSSVVAMHARAWGQAFQRLYPDVTVTVAATNSGAATTAMLGAATTLGMTSRPITSAERAAMTKQYGQPPLELRVAVDAVAIYVHKDNPIKSITLTQLERIYGASPKRGTPVLRWGELGLAGDWAERRITTIGFDAGRGAYETMRDLVLKGGNFNASTSAEPVSSSVPQAVAVDPAAIGYASAYYATARTRLLPVQGESGENQLTEPNETDSASGKYPLSRFLFIHVSAPKNASPAMREFLLFVLSPEAQSSLRATGAYAITPAQAREQIGALAP